MSATIKEGVIHVKENDNVISIYPKTNITNVEGLQSALDGKVNTESGKGLSSNDFTDADIEAIAEVIDTGKKNIIKNTVNDYSGLYNVFLTHNADDTITVYTQGATTGQFLVPICLRPSDVENGREYTLSGCPAGGSSESYMLTWEGSTTYGIECLDIGEGSTTIPNEHFKRILLVIRQGVNIPTPIIFKPMLCLTSLWNISKKYVQYAPSNKELYDLINSSLT